MPTVADLKLELDDATTLKLISSAFTEAAASRVGKIKTEFERNRAFYDEISHVYHLVRVSGDNKEADGKTAKKAGEGNMLSVAVTSNARFYGNLNYNIMHTFIDDTEKKKTDLLVIGATGRDYLTSTGFEKHYEILIFTKDNPSPEEARAFLDRSNQYDTVLLYFPKFVTLMSQTVGITDITQASSSVDKIEEDEKYVLFEPDLSLIRDFFKRQVRSLLFLRVMLEADLSRTAARLLTMSGAEERSSEMIKIKKSQLRKIQSSIVNAKLLETFAAIKGVRK